MAVLTWKKEEHGPVSWYEGWCGMEFIADVCSVAVPAGAWRYTLRRPFAPGSQITGLRGSDEEAKAAAEELFSGWMERAGLALDPVSSKGDDGSEA